MIILLSKQPSHLPFSEEGGDKRGILEKYVNSKWRKSKELAINVEMTEIPSHADVSI